MSDVRPSSSGPRASQQEMLDRFGHPSGVFYCADVRQVQELPLARLFDQPREAKSLGGRHKDVCTSGQQ